MIGALTAALSYAAHFGCLATQAAVVNANITKQNNNFLFMIVEFDDKYKTMILVRFTLILLFSTPFWAISKTPQYKCYKSLSDTLPKQYLLINNPDTIVQSDNLAAFQNKTILYLKRYWNKGYALARCELLASERDSSNIKYVFIQGKYITKGKITGWNAEIMDERLAPFVLDWRKGRLLTSQMSNNFSNGYGIQINSTELFFEDSIAQLKVNMGPSNNQYFDGLMGLQQIEGKSVLVGDFKINWINSLKKGESLFLRWQRQDVSTQRLELKAEIPFIFHRAFGWTNYFDFYRKKDQVFQTHLKSQLLIHLQNRQTWSSGIELKNNQSLSTGDQLYSQHQLWVNTWSDQNLILEFAAGRRKATQTISESVVKKNDKLYRWECHWLHGWEQKSWILNVKLHSLGYYAQELEMAEMLRIGGPKNIRGFNVESIFVSLWNGFQSEWGYQLPNVLGYLFADGGISQTLAIRNYHQSYGLGSRINRNDIQLSLEYGWGIFPKQSIDFRQGILHIGFNQRF